MDTIQSSAQGCESEDDFKGLFDDFDVNSNKLGGTVAKRNERLVKLMNGVASMQLGDYQENNIDAFGDAYEYLMGIKRNALEPIKFRGVFAERLNVAIPLGGTK